MDEIFQCLSNFNVQVEHFEQWFTDLIEQLESRELNKLTHDEFVTKIEQMSDKRDQQKNKYEDMIGNGKNLISKKDVSDVGIVREKVKVKSNFHLIQEKKKTLRND